MEGDKMIAVTDNIITAGNKSSVNVAGNDININSESTYNINIDLTWTENALQLFLPVDDKTYILIFYKSSKFPVDDKFILPMDT